MEALTSQLYSPSLELIALVGALVADAVVAYIVLRSAPKNATNLIFALLSLVTILWLINNYVTNQLIQLPEFAYATLLISRSGIALAAPMSSLFFLLAHTFPSERLELKRPWYWAVVASTIGMVALNLSPYAFVGVSTGVGAAQLQPGIGLMPFSVLSTLFSILAIYWLFRKYNRAHGIEKKRLRLVLMGILIMLGLIIVTVLAPIIAFNSVAFLPVTPLYTLVFLGMTAYAIAKYQLFSVKVLVTEALTVVLWVILFAKVFVDESSGARLIDAGVLFFTVLFGFFLVRSVRREVEQRELIERQEKALEHVNAKLKEIDREKTEFVSIASHQLRSPLTAIKGYASMVLEGSYGPIIGEMKGALEHIYNSSELMAASVQDFLDVSRIEQGRMRYEFKPMELGVVVRTAVEELQTVAHKKNLTLTYKSEGEPFMVSGDMGKLKQVFSNLVDNSLKYTPSGTVDVTVAHGEGIVRVEIRDTGCGMSKETLDKIFDKFVRADNANKVNVSGTGLGLYVAREFVKAHKGKIWAESEGENKGSRFIVELPVLQQQRTP